MVATEVSRASVADPASHPMASALIEQTWQALGRVVDPEIHVVSIVELGIVRGVLFDGATLVIEITPTYSGCPATDAIVQSIDNALDRCGIVNRRINVTLAPPWTTDRITPEAKRRLRDFGIAPPHGASSRIDAAGMSPLRRAITVACPRCGSSRTRLVSQFGSTACKAHYRCENCLEPFDYFKSF
jgi:ring-1,2-phenylacetyl-CoA epoxidase subunit PaaD